MTDNEISINEILEIRRIEHDGGKNTRDVVMQMLRRIIVILEYLLNECR